MEKIRLILLAGCLFCGGFTRAQNPGGIGTGNLMVWLRGDAGVSPGATFTWTDQSGNGRSGVQATAADQPTVTTTAAQYMNYNPGLNFVANQWLILGTSVNTAGTTASEFYLVYQNVHSAPDGFVLGTETPGNRLYYWGSGVVQLGSSGKPATIAPGY